MQLAPAAVYFILPADGVIPPAVLLHLLTDGSTVFQISPVETNKYHFLSREIHLLLINSMQLVEVVDNGHNGKLVRLLTPENSHLQPTKPLDPLDP